MKTTPHLVNKFRGGILAGLMATTWPGGVLEFDDKKLILRDILIGKEYIFLKSEGVKIEVKKYFPIFAYGIKIHHTNKRISNRLYFWYHTFLFKELVQALKKCGWIDNQ